MKFPTPRLPALIACSILACSTSAKTDLEDLSGQTIEKLGAKERLTAAKSNTEEELTMADPMGGAKNYLKFDRKGQLRYGDKVYAEIGLNLPNLFQDLWNERSSGRMLNNENSTMQNTDQFLGKLAKLGFTTIRTYAHPKEGSDLLATLEDQEKKESIFFESLDQLLDLTKRHNIKLVLSLGSGHFHLTKQSTRSQAESIKTLLASPQSPERKALNSHLIELVARYKDHPSILIWEIHDNLSSQINTAASDQSVKGPNLLDLAKFYHETSKVIKEVDPQRLVSSGDGALGEKQWQVYTNSSKDRDNYADHIKAFELIYSNSSLDFMSIDYAKQGLLLASPISKHEILNIGNYKKISRVVKRPLIISEFTPLERRRGKLVIDSQSIKDSEATDTLHKQLTELVDSGVNLAFFCCIEKSKEKSEHNANDSDGFLGHNSELISILKSYNDKLKNKPAL